MSGTLENPMLTLSTAPAPSPTPTGPTSIPLIPTPAPTVDAQLTPTDPNDIFAPGQSVDLSAIVSELANSNVAGDTLTLDSISFATGSANLVNGDVVYTTPSSGSGAIDYTVSDQYGATTTGTLDFTIDPGPPTKPGSITIGHGQTENLAGYVESLVTPGLSGDTVQLLSVSTANGQTSLADTKAGTVLDYTAPASGTDTLTYTPIRPNCRLLTYMRAYIARRQGGKNGALHKNTRPRGSPQAQGRRQRYRQCRGSLSALPSGDRHIRDVGHIAATVFAGRERPRNTDCWQPVPMHQNRWLPLIQRRSQRLVVPLHHLSFTRATQPP